MLVPFPGSGASVAVNASCCSTSSRRARISAASERSCAIAGTVGGLVRCSGCDEASELAVSVAELVCWSTAAAFFSAAAEAPAGAGAGEGVKICLRAASSSGDKYWSLENRLRLWNSCLLKGVCVYLHNHQVSAKRLGLCQRLYCSIQTGT